MIPEPTMAASNSAVPSNSAATRFGSVSFTCDSDRQGTAATSRFGFGGFSQSGLVLIDVDTAFTRCRFREIILEYNKHFPLIAIRITNPRLVLNGITATGLHLIASQ